MSAPDITAIVCTHNRASYLPGCLDSLLRQSLPRDRYEILVVDNASTDSTADCCRRYEACGVRYCHDPVTGLSHARNTGWKAARGWIIAYLDDDAVASESWLESAWQAFRSLTPPLDGLGGPVLLLWDVPEPAWMNAPLRAPLGFVDWGTSPRRLLPSEWIIGANCFYSRERLQQLGGFDERLGRKGACLLSGEETLMQKRIEQAGGYLYYEPRAAVQHHVTPDRAHPAWFYHRYFWGGISDAILRRTAPGASMAMASAPVAGSAETSPCRRLIGNTLAAAGLGGRVRRIQARIYMAYVFGWVLAKTGLRPTGTP